MRKETIVQPRRKANWITLLKGKLVLWLITIGALMAGWSIIDAPVGPGEPVIGRVIGFQLTGHNHREMIIELPSGAIIRKGDPRLKVGSQVSCLRYVKRYWPNESYECP